MCTTTGIVATITGQPLILRTDIITDAHIITDALQSSSLIFFLEKIGRRPPGVLMQGAQ